MKKLMLTGTALGLLTTAALGADLPARVAPPVVLPPPAPTWSGFYIGANLGYGGDTYVYPYTIAVGNASRTTFNYATTSSGILGGGQVGYNFVVPGLVLPYAGGLVFGAEADFDAASVGGNSNLTANSPTGGNPSGGAAGTKLREFGTVRGRGGISFGRLLLYGTGGFAYGRANTVGTLTSGAAVRSFSTSTSHTGTTFGAGIEFLVTQNISFKIEYLRATLDTRSVTAGSFGTRAYAVSVRPSDTIVRGGINYKFDFLRPAPPVVAAY